MATKNVTVIFDRKGKVLKNGSGEVEIRIYLCRNQGKYIKVCWKSRVRLTNARGFSTND